MVSAALQVEWDSVDNLLLIHHKETTKLLLVLECELCEFNEVDTQLDRAEHIVSVFDYTWVLGVQGHFVSVSLRLLLLPHRPLNLLL